jgi:hypothetical protein
MRFELKRAHFRLACVLLFFFSIAKAQVTPVAPSYQGMFASSEPTLSFLFRAADAKATLVFIPGGEGRAGVKADWTADHGYFSKYYFNLMLRSLTDAKVTSGAFNLVIFDSPVELPTSGHWSVARTTGEHLSRVEDVVRHFAKLLGKPVWVMGHSMGVDQPDRVLQAIAGTEGREPGGRTDSQWWREWDQLQLRIHQAARADRASRKR